MSDLAAERDALARLKQAITRELRTMDRLADELLAHAVAAHHAQAQVLDTAVALVKAKQRVGARLCAHGIDIEFRAGFLDAPRPGIDAGEALQEDQADA